MGESDHRQELISIIAVLLSSELNKLTSPYCLFALDNLGGIFFHKELRGVGVSEPLGLNDIKRGTLILKYFFGCLGNGKGDSRENHPLYATR